MRSQNQIIHSAMDNLNLHHNAEIQKFLRHLIRKDEIIIEKLPHKQIKDAFGNTKLLIHFREGFEIKGRLSNKMRCGLHNYKEVPQIIVGQGFNLMEVEPENPSEFFSKVNPTFFSRDEFGKTHCFQVIQYGWE